MTEVDVRVPSDGFAVAPELAADTFAKLSEVQDAVGRMVRRAKVLGRSVPLGDGYAREIGEFMARYGIADTGSAVESLTRFGQEIESLKQRIDTALRRYDEQDRAASDGVDCVGGG
ncbi:hypothetical protein [Saccharomonospora cyanea]|uniref:PE domain-containing protein n=1 Tax=Saccharomonospora cyanea NA-134 TaxID=882082 RepID=H5XPV5_9PSEU|nr:hypothetical protein [Saccharomonospora cyanea]EHR62180.1 hypothetical protein SaccyDRAFT_3346 [Saccharomonospora cyanea NA-134]